MEQLWDRFAALPLSSLEKGAIYASIKDLSLEELRKLLPPFLDNLGIAATLRRLFITPEGEGFRSQVAYWGTPSLLSIAPSSFNNSTCKVVQEGPHSGPGFLNFRPSVLQPFIPLQLAHPLFGTFLDIYNGAEGAPQPQQEDYDHFLKLSASCSSFWKGEVSDYRPMIRQLWHNYTGFNLVQELFTGNTRERRNSAMATDVGFALEALRALIAIFEAKLRMTGTGTDSEMQGLQNYRLYWAKVGDEALFSTSCFPGLLIEHIGAFIRVSAVANLNNISCQPLTPFVNLLQIQGHDVAAAKQAVRLCFAVKKTMEGLVKFYTDVSVAVPGVPRLLIEQGVPYPLQMRNITPRRWGNKLVYLVAEQNMIVKYVQGEYGEAVHRAWAAAGYAPLLLEPVKPLPGGWVEVRMEYLGDGWKVLQSRSDADVLRPRVLEVLEEAHRLPVGRSVGVHGDMRDMNVMVNESGGVKFIDFDWAREQGRGFYPAFMNHVGVKWADGAAAGLPMLQEHDRKLLAKPQSLQSIYV